MKTVGKTFPKRVMRKASLQGKTVLLRADYNVPLEEGVITDDFKIRSSVPTVQKLLEYGCKVVIISHLGRPKGPESIEFSLEPAAMRLSELLGEPVRFVDQCIGPKVKMAVKRAPMHSVTVLENLRFHPEEKANDPDFAASLAKDTGAEYFVQDGFGVVHRAHASTSAITMLLPSVAGLLLEREYTAIVGAMKHPRRPLLALMGGSKVSDKIPIIKQLIRVADQIVIGGAMANTFLAYKGYDVGASKVEPDQTAVIDDIYDLVRRKVGTELADNFLVIPTDVAVGTHVDDSARRRTVTVDKIPKDSFALDIGDASIERTVAAIERSQTIIWNGTLGMTEHEHFAHGSARAALALAEHPEKESIIGGGDTAGFAIQWDGRHGDSFSHVSTGGGASLELMAGDKLPGIEALLDA
jgi:phosphoglycerate kinase